MDWTFPKCFTGILTSRKHHVWPERPQRWVHSLWDHRRIPCFISDVPRSEILWGRCAFWRPHFYSPGNGYEQFCVCVCGFVVQCIGSDNFFSLKISLPNNIFSPTFLYCTEEKRFLCLTVCYEWDITEGVFCVCTYYAWMNTYIRGINEILDSVYLKFVLSLHSARNHQ